MKPALFSEEPGVGDLWAIKCHDDDGIIALTCQKMGELIWSYRIGGWDKMRIPALFTSRTLAEGASAGFIDRNVLPPSNYTPVQLKDLPPEAIQKIMELYDGAPSPIR